MTHLKLFHLPFILMVALSCHQPADPDPAPPNILFIMTDDHACQAMSAYDTSLLQTPNLDRIVNEGMLFRQSFVTNSICSPSRAVALTGKFSHLNSVRDNIDKFDSTQITFPKLLRQNGYQTAVVGKWHLKSQPTGFDYWKVLPGQGHYYHPEFRTPEGIVKEQGYVTDLITDFALGFMDSIRDAEKPFLLMYNHKAPHRQWWPAMEDLPTLRAKEYPEPATLFDDYAGRGSAARDAEMRLADHMGLTMDNKLHPDVVKEIQHEEFMRWYEPSYLHRKERLSDDERAQWEAVYSEINAEFQRDKPTGDARTSWQYQRYMQDYLGVIKSVDRNVGRILEYLEENGLAENTLVIYTSDQGFYLGEHGWFDKRFMYEQSLRTPLAIKWPEKIQPQSVNDDLVQNLDLAPTILEAAGVSVPTEMQGKSMIPIFAKNREPWRDAIYYHYYEYPGIHMVKRHYGVRTDRYKLIHFYYDIDEWELYDLEKDPDELQNVYEDKSYASIRDDLHARLKELREEYQDSDALNQQFIQQDLARAGK